MALDEKDLRAISDLLDSKFEKELRPIKEDISCLKEDVSVLKEKVSGLEKDVSVLKEDVSVLKEDVSVLKEDVSSLQSQMNHLEEKVDGIDDRLKRVEHNQEHEMFRTNMLYETFIPTSRITRLEEKIERIGDDVAIMKIAMTELASSVSKGRGNGFCAATV